MTIEIASSYGSVLWGWLSANFLTLAAFLISLFSIRAANAAKVQAQHAATQAGAAEQQAAAAATQARAAEQQVDLMRDTLRLDQIGIALRIRRTVIEIREAVEAAKNGVRAAKSSGSRAVHMQLGPLRELAARLEDYPPALPQRTRAIVIDYVQDLNGLNYETVTGPGGVPVEDLQRKADMITAAIDVAIAAQIEQLKGQ